MLVRGWRGPVIHTTGPRFPNCKPRKQTKYMHYKNGRLAQENDPVITRNPAGKLIVGQVFDLQAAETCNCSVARMHPGGTDILFCQTVGTMYHAEDALAAVDTPVAHGL